MDVDTFGQDAVVEDHKLTVRIFAPSIESLEELLTVDLSLVHKSTELAGDVEHIVTFVMKEVKHTSLSEQVEHDLTGRTAAPDLVTISINIVDEIGECVLVRLIGELTLDSLEVNLVNNLRSRMLPLLTSSRAGTFSSTGP